MDAKKEAKEEAMEEELCRVCCNKQGLFRIRLLSRALHERSFLHVVLP